MKPLALCLLFPVLAGSALALDWKTKELSVKSVPLQRTAETAFEFKNSSDKTVTILGVDTSCDCTEAAPSASTFAPGTSGRISAKFNLGDRQGQFERTITISTDEAGAATVTLRVQLDVPEIAILTPRSVEWKLNGPATEQAVDIAITPGVELTISNVLPTSGLFNHRLETVEAGRHYRLYLAPQSTHDVSNAAFRIYAKAKTGQDVVFSAYGNVR